MCKIGGQTRLVLTILLFFLVAWGGSHNQKWKLVRWLDLRGGYLWLTYFVPTWESADGGGLTISATKKAAIDLKIFFAVS